jgi:hypothetical protein
MIPSFCRIIKPEPGETDSKNVPARISSPEMRLLYTGILLLSFLSAQGQALLLDQPVTFQRQNTTLYNALNLISDKTGCLFVYDSQVVESDKRVRLEANRQPLKQVLDNLLSNPELTYKVIGQHILIYRKSKLIQLPKPNTTPVPAVDSITQILIRGHVYDNQSKKPIPYVNVGILEENLGTITNADGYFFIKVPTKFSGSSLVVSHIGFMSQRIPIQLLEQQQVDLFLERRIISIQEVIIRYTDPMSIITKSMEQRKLNYNKEPVYTTTFYREGVQKNDHMVSYSEAVFRVYKSPYDLDEQYDQVKLLKSRKIQNVNQKDTVSLKLKAGILSGLQLDIVKTVPSFLDLAESQYTYTYSDMVSYNDQDVYAITFTQNKGIDEALFKGTLYIDKESYAILGADFEINPDYLDKAAENMVLKKSHKLVVKLEKISYSVSYSLYNGRYYLNHARGDLRIRTRFRNHLWSDRFNTFLEIATCHIDTLNVVRFGRQEVLKPDVVFSDTPFVYDDTFWGNYNIIAPEEKLNEALSRIISKIEKIE